MFAERAFSVILCLRVCFFLVFICTKVLFRKRPRACHCTGRHRSLPSSVYFQSGIQTWRGHIYEIKKKHNHHSKQRTQRHGSTKHCGSITTTLRTENPILQRGKKLEAHEVQELRRTHYTAQWIVWIWRVLWVDSVTLATRPCAALTPAKVVKALFSLSETCRWIPIGLISFNHIL